MSMTAHNHSELNALGHEIHISRFILLDMLHNNYITSDDTIVTLYEDRKFLYTNLFKTVIIYKEFLLISTNSSQIKILNLCELSYTPHITEDRLKQFENISNYPIRTYIPEYVFNNYNLTKPLVLARSEHNFDYLLNNINYPDISDFAHHTQSKFIVIHHRVITINQPHHIKKNIEYYNTILTNLINSVKCKYNTIFIFSINEYDNIKSDNIIYINKLDIYASLLAHTNCDGIISEWSGGGQLSHYCHNNKVLYYFDHYSENNYCVDKDNLIALANHGIYDAFDFHKTRELQLFMYKTINDLLFYLNNLNIDNHTIHI
jgi:hypothetical protein